MMSEQTYDRKTWFTLIVKSDKSIRRKVIVTKCIRKTDILTITLTLVKENTLVY